MPLSGGFSFLLPGLYSALQNVAHDSQEESNGGMVDSPKKAKDLGLKTRHVFLDTQVYRQYGHNLHAKVMQSLLNRIKEDICTLHIADITKSEITRQIGDLAVEAAQAVSKSNKEINRWYGRLSRKAPAPTTFDATDMARQAVTHFDVEMATTWKTVRHDALDLSPKAIFASYFRRDPPFQKKGSKEFPDAFAVAALDQWCQLNHVQMYVVTRDGPMKDAAARTKTLIPLSSLDDFLQLIVEAQHPDILERVDKILSSKAWDTIQDGIKEQIPPLGTVYVGSLYDGEVVDHYPGNEEYRLEDFHVISATDEEIEVVAKVAASVAFEVQYLDTTEAMYDREDDTYIGAETRSATFEQEVPISVLLVIDAEDNEVMDVDIITRDLYLEEPGEEW